MVFVVQEWPEPDRTKPEGQLEFILNKAHRLVFELDPAYHIAELGDPMPNAEVVALLREVISAAEQLRGHLTTARMRRETIAKQRALGALPWLAIKHIMLERGFTHINTYGGPQPLATYEGPYGNGIPEYYHALLLPDKGPGWFADCDPDPDTSKFFMLGAWECITHWPEPSRDHHMVEYDLAYAGGEYSLVGDYCYVPVNWVQIHGMDASFTKQTGHAAIHIINWSQEDPRYTSAGEEIWEEQTNG